MRQQNPVDVQLYRALSKYQAIDQNQDPPNCQPLCQYRVCYARVMLSFLQIQLYICSICHRQN